MRAHALARRVVAPGMGAGVAMRDKAGAVHKTRFIQAVYAAHFLYLAPLTPGEFHSSAVLYGFIPFYAGPNLCLR